MRKNIGNNKNLAKRREARENKRKKSRIARRKAGMLLKIRQAEQIILMNKLYKEAVKKRQDAEAKGEVFENDILTDLIKESKLID